MITSYLKQGLYWLGSVMVLIAPALYNRYPLVYFDSGAYMEMSVGLGASFHRTLGYPLLLKFTGLGISNWPIVFIQGLIVSVLLYKLVEVFIEKQNYLIHFLSCLYLAFASTLSWYTAQLMPDIFTFILILSVALLMFKTNAAIKAQIALSGLVFISLLTHLSHIPLLFLLLVSWFILSRIKSFHIPSMSKGVLIALSTPLVASYIALSAINATQGHGFRLGISSNVFITANLSEMGILKMYLEENCGKIEFPYCEKLDQLPIETGGFLWDKGSYIALKDNDWKAANEECAPIVHDFLTKPRYLKWFVFSAVKATFKQLFQIELGSGLQYQYGVGSSPYWPMKTHFKQELNEYLGSVQNKKDKLPIDFFKWMNYLSLFASIGLIAWAALSKRLSNELLVLLLFFILAYFFHAAITGVLANVYDRLQARTLPLIQLMASLILAAEFAKRKLEI